jgi:hypothetical protein
MMKLNEPTKLIRFSLGKIVATPGAFEALKNANQTSMEFIRLHAAGDWSDLGDEDKRQNDEAIAHENTTGTDNDLRGRVLSVYHTTLGEKLYVITEADRSSTCLLLPDEY